MLPVLYIDNTKTTVGTREMALWLIACIALAKDPSSVLSTQDRQLTTTNNFSSMRSDVLLWSGLWRHLYTNAYA